MEPYENEEYTPSPEPQEPVSEPVSEPAPQMPQYGTHHSAGTGRKESPYANSPYVRQEPRQESRGQEPAAML
mgnify:CR=1 FL=1